MGKQELNPGLIAVISIVVLIIIVAVGFHTVQPATPDAGSYTPGVPPWLDPKHKNDKGAAASPFAHR